MEKSPKVPLYRLWVAVLTWFCRDKTLFLTHVIIASLLGVFVGMHCPPVHPAFLVFIEHPGGLYFKTGTTIAGFQSRVGCLFFLVSYSDLSTSVD